MLRKHRDLLIESNNQEQINKSAEKLANKLVLEGFDSDYDKLLKELGYHEIKQKRKK